MKVCLTLDVCLSSNSGHILVGCYHKPIVLICNNFTVQFVASLAIMLMCVNSVKTGKYKCAAIYGRTNNEIDRTTQKQIVNMNEIESSKNQIQW